eukprot:g17760.t1
MIVYNAYARQIKKHIMDQLVELRHEVLWSSTFRSWREEGSELLWSLNPGMIVWPTQRQLDEERKKPLASSWMGSSPSSVAHRQGKCTIEGSRCRQYDPILFVPQSLMDSLEVSTDLKRAVKQLMEEATSLTADQRLELLPGLPPHDVYFDLYEPIPNGAPSFAAERGGICGRFRIREERWQREMAASSSKLAIKRLSDMQFVCNEMLLPELVSWCDQYKAIKAKRLGEKAFHLAEE